MHSPPETSEETSTWQRVAHLLRVGAVFIAMAGIIKASGILVKAVSFVMLLLYYLSR